MVWVVNTVEAPSEVTSRLSLAGEPSLLRRLGRDTTTMVVLTFLASVVNYASSIVFSHLLSPSSFGDLTVLFTLSVVIAVPSGAAQTVIAGRLATFVAQGRDADAAYLIRYAVAYIGLIALIVAVVYMACVPLVDTALKLQSLAPAFALAPLLALSFFVPLAYGVLQGVDRFVVYGFVALGIAVSRIAIGVPWTLAGGGATAPLLGQSVGSVLALAAVAWVVRARLIGPGTGAAHAGLRRGVDRRSVAVCSAFVAFAVISSLDLLLAKLLLSATAGGYYAALATLEKIVIFLPGAAAIVMVPNAARQRLAEGSAVRVLRIAAVLVLMTTLVVAVPAALAPHLVLETMFGASYTSAVSGVLPIVCAGSAIALLYLLVVYTVVIGDQRWVWLLIAGMVVQIGSILALHSSPTQIAVVQAVVVWVLLAVNELFLHPLLPHRPLRLHGRSASTPS
jgi:O-antigen/teichoic acid export membrane protein